MIENTMASQSILESECVYHDTDNNGIIDGGEFMGDIEDENESLFMGQAVINNN